MVSWLFKKSPTGLVLTFVSGGFSFLLLFYMIAKSPPQLRYDEAYHLNLAKIIETKGLREGLVDPDNQSAAGPLYAVIHNMFRKITNHQAPNIRWVNGILLLAAIVLIAFIQPQQVLNTPVLACVALSLLSVPFLWPSAGMALTEVPALTCFCAFLFSLQKLFACSSPVFRIPGSVIFAVSAGIFLGLAILGRQTYLVVLPPLFLLFLTGPVRPRFVAIMTILPLLVSGWVFYIWGGFVPPSQAKVNEGLKWEHGLFSLAYVAAATAFFSPQWLLPKKKAFVFPVAVLGAFLAALSRDYSEPPGKSLLIRFLGHDAGMAVGFLVFACLGALGLNWLFNTCMELWERREDSFHLLCGLILLALVIAPVKISHLFSSRYVVGLLGVLLVVLQPIPSKFLAARILMGSLIGAAILYSYYYS